MTLFETVKHSVTVKQAAEHYGFEVNRGDMICCGATGDVIDFVARLFGLSSYEAAKKLAYDFGIDPDKPPAAMALKKPYPLARAFRNDEMYCQRVLCDYLHLLERWKVEYAPRSPEDELDDRFVEACHMKGNRSFQEIIARIRQKLRSSRKRCIGVLLILLGIVLGIVSRAAGGSPSQDFTSGILMGLSAGILLVGILAVLLSFIRRR